MYQWLALTKIMCRWCAIYKAIDLLWLNHYIRLVWSFSTWTTWIASTIHPNVSTQSAVQETHQCHNKRWGKTSTDVTQFGANFDTSLSKRMQSCNQWCRVDRLVPAGVLHLHILLLLLLAPAPLPHHSEVFKHIVSLTATLLPTPNPHTVHTGTPALTQGRYRYFSGTFNSSVVECRWEAAVGKPPEPPGRPAPQLPACPQTFHDYRKLSLSKECIPSIISYSTNLVNQEKSFWEEMLLTAAHWDMFAPDC